MKEIIQSCVRKGCLIEPDLLDLLRDVSPLICDNLIETILAVQNRKILTKNIFFENIKQIVKIFEQIGQTGDELKKNAIQEFFQKFCDFSKEKEEKELVKNYDSGLEIVKSYNIQSRKVTVEDFVKYFKARLIELKNVLQERTELTNLTSINKISSQRQNVSIIGIIYNIKTTKNKNIILEIEDMTGKITTLVHNSKEDLIKKAKELVADEVVGLRCNGNSEILFVNDIVTPDIFVEKKKTKGNGYAAFIADLHVGSTKFLEETFLKFIKWINGELGNEQQREISKKVKYLFIVGDIVDGVGIYPGQEDELSIKNISEQYQKAAELLGQIRGDVNIVICPGNHDAVRITEPQPQLDLKYAESLYKLKNAFFVSNPAIINLHNGNEKGFDILLYHGYSFDYYANNIDAIRLNGGYKKPELIMHFLLKKRHLAPTHSSTLYFPQESDPLIIGLVPDIFVSAHVHKSAISQYNNILTISCSCWQAKTSFQEKVGHEPDPCKVPLLNLENGKINMLDFSGQK